MKERERKKIARERESKKGPLGQNFPLHVSILAEVDALALNVASPVPGSEFQRTENFKEFSMEDQGKLTVGEESSVWLTSLY